MVTQVQIAREVGVDVSSVNKILNLVPGPKFKKSTIKAVRRAAARHGYRRKCATCRQLMSAKGFIVFESGRAICAECIAVVRVTPFNAPPATFTPSAPPIEIQPTGILEAHEARRKAVSRG